MKEEYAIQEMKMEKVIEQLKGEYQTIRAGRANATILDKIHIDYYGTPTQINQVGTVSVPDPKTLLITP